MDWLHPSLEIALALALGLGLGLLVPAYLRRRRQPRLSALLKSHFHPAPPGQLTVAERLFPFRVRADLQRALDRLFREGTAVRHFSGVHRDYSHEDITFAALLLDQCKSASIPPQYEEVDVGADEPVRCLKNGLWLLQ